MSIGRRIKEKRKELKISADELAIRIGKDRSTIYRYEKGDIENLPIDILEPIAAALSTTPQYLMGWEEEKPTTKIDSGISEVKTEMIKRVMQMSDEELQKLDLLLRVVESK